MSQPPTYEYKDENGSKEQSNKSIDKVPNRKTMSQADSASQLNGVNNKKMHSTMRSASDGKLILF